ncbi:MAG: metalloprotease PmbA, partial [Xanthomonadales bacterium]|nr:metalloprotease PmbA [Xanthomonadales bacterium]
VDHAIESALACETAGREDVRITNVDGTNWSSGGSAFAYANSHGFVGVERGTSHTISCSLIAGRGDAMQRDYWYDHARAANDMISAESIGRRAAERALARLDPRPICTGRYPVLYSAELARSLVGHFLNAVAGSSQYRRSSFLLDACGKAVFPDWLQMTERPHRPRGHRSANFDAEGVATADRPLVIDGRLDRYVLGSYSARKLGLESTGNAGGMHNLELSIGDATQAELVRQLGSGLLLTELMGQGVNGITGDYSRGAAGFWVENGEIAHPVDGITVAANLRDMFMAIEAIGADVDPRSHIRTGSILVGAMTVAAD